jgi:alkylated DNA repair dioxygenase AlkB
MLTLQTEYWTYKPKFIPSYVFPVLYEIMKDYCQQGSSKKRISCFFDGIHNLNDDKSFDPGYGSIPGYRWNNVPDILIEICKLVEQYTKENYDYVLVHIYPDGESGINWHNDSEGLNSSIASISLGSTRKFRFKKIGRKEGWDTELKLNDGDLVWMHGPDTYTGRPSCQKIYLHTVPIEKTVKTPRINLTFRQYQ